MRYVAADVSLGQLGRARRRAAKRHLSQIQLVEASMTELPFADGEFDLVLSLNGLNCMDAPEASLAELARCLRPGGWLIGSTIVRGAGRRFDWTIRHWQWRGGFGPVETAEDVSRWLESAGFPEAELQRSGAVAYFSARRPDPPHDQSRA